MRSHHPLWLSLAVLPFAVPGALLVARWTVASFHGNPAAKTVLTFLDSYWPLIIMIPVLVGWILYLIHAVHSASVPAESRRFWTLLIFFLGPYAIPFYYAKFIAGERQDRA
jgi:hypothetical protein